MFCRMIIACVLLSLTSTNLWAQEAAKPKPPFTGVITGNNVYVRAWASENYYPITKLNTGDLVEVTEELYGWYVIKAPAGTFSYISQQYVQLDEDGKTGTVTGNSVRVRAPSPAGPARSYKSQLQLDRGAKVTVLGSEDGWYKIAPPEGAKASVSGKYIAKATAKQIAVARGQKATDTDTTTTTNTTTTNTTNTTTTDDGTPKLVTTTNVTTDPNTTTTTTTDGDGTTATATDTTTTDTTTTDTTTTTTTTTTTDTTTTDTTATDTTTTTDATAGTSASSTKLAALEKQFAEASAKPLGEQPIAALQKAYGELAADEALKDEERILVNARLDVLRTRAEFNAMQAKLDAARAQLAQKQAATAKDPATYDAVGKLLASTLYTGDRLPLLYRLVDPLSGRTVGYVQPKADGSVRPLLGQIVGIEGTTKYHPGLKLNVISVERMDALAAVGG